MSEIRDTTPLVLNRRQRRAAARQMAAKLPLKGTAKSEFARTLSTHYLRQRDPVYAASLAYDEEQRRIADEESKLERIKPRLWTPASDLGARVLQTMSKKS